MEENTNTATAPEQEEAGIDIMALLRNLWDGRKTIFICLGIFIVLGLLAAFTMKRSYSVTTVMVPQTGSSKSGLSNLASLAGFDMGTTQTNGELSPLIYPQIVSSTPFSLQMIHTPLHYEKCDTLISMFDYAEAGYSKPSAFDYIKKYTIGLPGVIMGSLRSKPKEIEIPSDGGTADDGMPKPLVVSLKEQEMVNGMGSIVSLSVDKKEGYITMVVNGSEPIQTAELATTAQRLLQEEITRFRVEKSQSDLDYIQARYNEIKQENDRLQVTLASINDRMQSTATSSVRVERDRIQAKYNISNAVFNEMAKQLEQAKMQVKKDTPVFTVIQPVTVPTRPANSRVKTLIIWVFLGLVVGCGIVLVKYYWPTLKEKMSGTKQE